MGTKIKGAEYPLYKIFNSEFDFEVPQYQRPYSWQKEQVSDLFNDLYQFFKEENEDEQYFLGSIVLVKKEDVAHSDIIDGQQRLTTLTIFLAALNSKMEGQRKADFRDYIIEKGKSFEGLEPKPRLKIGKKDNEFFSTYIQGDNFVEILSQNPEKQNTDAKRNIITAAKLLNEKIDECFSDVNDLLKFAEFIIKRCYLVVVSTSTPGAAFRIFSVMNSRGLDLQDTDVLKAEIIGCISEENQSRYSDKWEEMEQQAGRTGFNELFTHIRMIYAKEKARKNLLEEFRSKVIPELNEKKAKEFIDEVLDKYYEAYIFIKRARYTDVSEAEANNVDNILRWLNRIDNWDWIPVAMEYYVKKNPEKEDLLSFYNKLERLAVFMRVVSMDATKRAERYGRVLHEINEQIIDNYNSLELTMEEKEAFIDRLNSDVYLMTGKVKNYLILRLDSFVSDGAAFYNEKIFSVEHVLPQTIREGSEWEEVWTDEDEREKWIHKIGNLVPLSRRQNSEAQNYNFDLKKEKYFKSKAGTTSYALTTQVLNYSQWTPEIVKNRQKELMDIFIDKWDLH